MDGVCVICGAEDVELHPLNLDPEAPVCEDCANSRRSDRNVPGGLCRIDECFDEATHKTVVNRVGGDREEEFYCEDHAELAAEDARNEPEVELFYGPVGVDDAE